MIFSSAPCWFCIYIRSEALLSESRIGEQVWLGTPARLRRHAFKTHRKTESVCENYLALPDHEYSSMVHFSHNAAVIKAERPLIHPPFQGESIKERFNRGVSIDGLIIFLLALLPHALRQQGYTDFY